MKIIKIIPFVIFGFFLVSDIAVAQTKKATTKKTTTKKTATPKNTVKAPSIFPTTITNATAPQAGSTNSIASLSESEVIGGLKEALIQAATSSSSILNSLDGFNKNMKVRIPFPPECEIVATKLRSMGLGDKVDDFEVTLNRAAEQAAKDAAPIFVNAIQSMTIVDAKNILTGDDNAATTYLRSTTTSALYTAFSPTVTNALNNTFATSKWKDITTIYNRIPFVKKVDTDLPRYATNQALSGLFIVVAEQEQKIRKDPAAQVTGLLQKVFGAK